MNATVVLPLVPLPLPTSTVSVEPLRLTCRVVLFAGHCAAVHLT